MSGKDEIPSHCFSCSSTKGSIQQVSCLLWSKLFRGSSNFASSFEGSIFTMTHSLYVVMSDIANHSST